ncbi:MAG: hypothetical protein R2941_09410 [Desulfobacterales bacterium]
MNNNLSIKKEEYCHKECVQTLRRWGLRWCSKALKVRFRCCTVHRGCSLYLGILSAISRTH